MDISPPLEFLKMRIKRYWRRRRYQKIQNASRRIKKKKKLKINRLGSKNQTTTTSLIDKKNKALQKLGSMMFFLSPLKLLMEKFHKAYVDAMMTLAAGEKIKRKRVGKGGSDPVLMSEYRNEMVDSRMVMEIYNRLVSLRDQSASAPPVVLLASSN